MFRFAVWHPLVALLCASPSLFSATLPPGFAEALVTNGLSNPTAFAIAPDGRIFVCEQGGTLRVIKNGSLLASPFLTVTVDTMGERGLLGVAFDPNFAVNQHVYIYYTATTPAIHNRVSRFTASGDTAVPGSEAVILDLDNLNATVHNGGAIHFGPDGKLYIAAGENLNGANAQVLTNLLGKILRINPDGSIPLDNPFFAAAVGVNRAIWALGLRNPFTFAFQRGTGRMFINDVGQGAWEEIDEGVAGSNYGWPDTEGYTNDPRFRSPLYAYAHGTTSTTGCAIVGAAFYNPITVQFPADYVGTYFFADLCSGWIRRFDAATSSTADFAAGISLPVDLHVSDEGSLYYLERGTGSLYRVRYTAATVSGPLEFVPLTACRIMDTRGPNGSFGGPFIGGLTTRTIPVVTSPCGVPPAAVAYSLNATVIPRAATLGYLTLWPTGQAQPNVSTLNAPDGSVLANAAIVPAGAGGSINVYALQDTDLVLDMNGYFMPPGAGALQFYPLAPCRVLDTRGPAGTFGGPALTGGAARSFPIRSSACGVPAAAQAYSLNLTAVPHGSLGFLTVWPTGQAQPETSTLNSLDGTILANAAIVQAGTGGAVSFYPMNTTDLVVDINGYFAPPGTGGLNFYTVNPCRILDTRGPAGALGGPVMNANATRTFPLPAGPCGLPATAGAYSLNIAVQPPAPLGYLTLWPTGHVQPGVSTLNDDKGSVTANAALVPAGTDGSVNVYVLDTTHVIIDTNGYFGH